jgi:DNA-binding transcriptional ArsR family regulator
MTREPSPPAGEPARPQLQAAAATFDLLSAPTRLHLMWLLARDDCDVGTLAARTGATVALVSQHLAKLRLAGLVTARRDGRRHIYAVDDPHVLTLIDQIFAHIAPDGTLAPDPPGPRRLGEDQPLAAETVAAETVAPETVAPETVAPVPDPGRPADQP